MVFHNQVVWGEEAGRHRFWLTWKLKHHQYPKEGYLILLPENDSTNLLEIISVPEMKYCQKKRGWKNLLFRTRTQKTIIGVGWDKEEAICVAAALVTAVYQTTGNLLVKDFFVEKG